ncbi:sodium:solute symporter family protein [Synergistes jonesii]|uniref:sodium:solute symporter family protein n=1 Tax=Synergistes jonesii TaxID=2754 RepID=UPI00242F9BCB|nr:sodium:solute symporter family protein [Synergistes jonesii]
MLLFYFSAFALLALFIAAGVVVGGRGGKKDYSLGGRKAGAAGVTGILLGALVGGASTVGTVQMAYGYGMTAWWFTLGGGIGCLMLGLRFASPLRASEITTVADYLEKSYGDRGKAIALAATVSSSLGTFISVCAQFLSCIALIRGVVPIPAWLAALVAALSIWGFIASGGIKSFAALGEAKIIILCVVLVTCAAAAAFRNGAAPFVDLSFQPWFNVFGRGFFPEVGCLASMIVGVFTTQIYLQSIAAAKDIRSARAGAFTSALLMPQMGLLGCWIGLTMRASGVDVSPDRALSWFIANNFPPLVGGLIWGGILITVIGCAAGLILGVATNISKNFIPATVKRKYEGGGRVEQLLVAAMISIAAFCAIGGAGSMILEWSFVSMGLRGSGTFLPLIVAILRPGALPPSWALASSAGGLAAMLLWAALRLPSDPLFAGLALSSLCVGAGLFHAKNKRK